MDSEGMTFNPLSYEGELLEAVARIKAVSGKHGRPLAGYTDNDVESATKHLGQSIQRLKALYSDCKATVADKQYICILVWREAAGLPYEVTGSLWLPEEFLKEALRKRFEDLLNNLPSYQLGTLYCRLNKLERKLNKLEVG